MKKYTLFEDIFDEVDSSDEKLEVQNTIQPYNFSNDIGNIVTLRTFAVKYDSNFKENNIYKTIYHIYNNITNTFEQNEQYIKQYSILFFSDTKNKARIEKNFIEDEEKVSEFIDNAINTFLKSTTNYIYILTLMVTTENVPDFNTFYKLITKITDNYKKVCRSPITYMFDPADIHGKEINYMIPENKIYEIIKIYNKVYNREVELEKLRTVKPNFKFTGPVYLSPNSPKLLSKFKFGDVLYCNSNNELVSGKPDDTSLTPVAICLKNDNDDEKSCRFIGLNYLSVENPDTGNNKMTTITFGLFNYNSTDKSTQEIYDYINSLDDFIELNWSKGPISVKSDTDYNSKQPIYGTLAPAITAAYRYRTFGTKRGQWEVPSKKDYYECFYNVKSALNKINKVRESLGYDPIFYDMLISTDIKNNDDIVVFCLKPRTSLSGLFGNTKKDNLCCCLPFIRVFEK